MAGSQGTNLAFNLSGCVSAESFLPNPGPGLTASKDRFDGSNPFPIGVPETLKTLIKIVCCRFP
jgi:hypothetical protein